MASARLPVPHPQVLFTEIDDGSGVLLHLDTKFYFTLNATGVVVWRALAERKGSGDVSVVVDRLVSEFQVTADVAQRDVAAVLEQLLADGLALPA